jgi:hypothetical protein
MEGRRSGSQPGPDALPDADAELRVVDAPVPSARRVEKVKVPRVVAVPEMLPRPPRASPGVRAPDAMLH